MITFDDIIENIIFSEKLYFTKTIQFLFESIFLYNVIHNLYL